MTVISFNNTTAKLFTKDRLAVDAAYKALSFDTPGARFTEAFKKGLWDGRTSFYKLHTSTFPTGLVGMTARALEKKGIAARLDDQRNPGGKAVPCPPGEVEKILTGVTLRDYQVAAVKAIFERTRGIIQAPTGSGKTKIAVAAIRWARKHNLKILFLTHRKELLYQTAGDISKSGGVMAGILGDQTKEFLPVTVGMVQTLSAGLPVHRPAKKAVVGGVYKTVKPEYRRSGDPETMTFLKSIDMLILDEAHRADARTWMKVCDACVNAYYRIGLTATPLMKGAIEDMKLIAATGEIIHQITIEDLIERNLLAQPYVKLVKITEPLLNQRFSWRKAYTDGVVHNEHRNRRIVIEAMKLVKAGRQVLVLVNEIKHGEILDRILGEMFRCRYIHGSKDTETRQQALRDFQAGKLDILVSSTITDEGVDIPAVSAVILAGGWKSPIKLYQRIGRGMRPKEGENNVFIVDFIDLTQKYLARHSLERYKLIKAEPGFKIVDNFEELLRAA
jgi:superfamily II DNA or RNA helicase